MTKPKKLIEVALPIREISAESVRDKSIRQGHISTLHKWWARRPLPVCRAVVFASLVPDPLAENTPRAFKDSITIELGSPEHPLTEPGFTPNAYKPYERIPYSAAHISMGDNPRNRLMMFIGKFSNAYCKNEREGKTTAAGDQLSDYSLIKWDNKNNPAIINKARRLIYVAYNATAGSTAAQLIAECNAYLANITAAEQALYYHPNRHIPSDEVKQKTAVLQQAIEEFQNRMPSVFDPFAGGGAIPLEAARLGCRSYGNDINPVAHIIQKGSVEFPQKYGKPMVVSREQFIAVYGEVTWDKQPDHAFIYKNSERVAVTIENRLAFDVEYYANTLLNLAEQQIGHYYPADANGNKPIAYYWARVGICSNPTCGAEVPLLKQFYLVNKPTKQVYLNPIIEGKNIRFEIKYGACNQSGWNNRGNLTCPVCNSVTGVATIKEQSKANKWKQKLLAVICEGASSKEYRLPLETEFNVLDKIPAVERPTEKMQRNSAGGDTFSWGISEWGKLFSARQLLAMQTLVKCLNEIKTGFNLEDEYNKAVISYLGIVLDKIALKMTSFGVWHTKAENVEGLFGRQAIPMVFDYPELNLFSDAIEGGLRFVSGILEYLSHESSNFVYSICHNASSGEKNQYGAKSITATVTDPPYYDAIAYADLSDYYYCWLKQSLGDVYPLNFATPQTPKTDECTALKHHHENDAGKAKQHFEDKLLQIFDAIEHQTSDIVSIMFAHQSTDAWTTLCNSILGARMNITGSWAIDTEMITALKTGKAFLNSSVTVSCIPNSRQGIGDFSEVKRFIQKSVEKEVEELFTLGFRGADLLTACFGKAVSEFGVYEKVEKADGTEVTVQELLELARESAFNALLKGFDGDDYTKFYIGWLQLYGFTESDFDDVAKFSRTGLNINVQDLFTEHIFMRSGNKQTLAISSERLNHKKQLGQKAGDLLIDKTHRLICLFRSGNRPAVLSYLKQHAAVADAPVWRVLNSLSEVLPTGSEELQQVLGLLNGKDVLLRDIKAVPDVTYTADTLDLQ